MLIKNTVLLDCLYSSFSPILHSVVDGQVCIEHPKLQNHLIKFGLKADIHLFTVYIQTNPAAKQNAKFDDMLD